MDCGGRRWAVARFRWAPTGAHPRPGIYSIPSANEKIYPQTSKDPKAAAAADDLAELQSPANILRVL